MGEVYTYDATHLTTVREGSVEFTQCAEMGQVGSGKFTLDDTAGTQAIVGQKAFAHTESSCSIPLSFRGYISDRGYGRDAGAGRKPHTGAARGIDVVLEDTNAMLGFDAFTASTANRPAETVAARGAWLMATAQMTGIADNGRCTFPSTKNMDKADYRNQYPGDVLADMALACGGSNYHVNDYGSGPELTFRDDNASTADPSTLRISNVLSDASSVTLNPFKDARLSRRPGRVYSLMVMQYAKGTRSAERAATAVTFNGRRTGIVSNSLVKTAAKAAEELANLLWQHHTEEDVLELTVLATSAQVNLMPPGWRIQGKFSHLGPEGYDSFTWFRIVELTKTPIVADAGLYEVRLKLSPQEQGCSSQPVLVQSKYDHSARITGVAFSQQITFPATVKDNLLILATVSQQADPMVAAVSSGWTWAVQNLCITVDGMNFWGNIFYKRSTGDAEFTGQYSYVGDTAVTMAMVEYSGLANPALYAAAVSERTGTSIGYSIVPATSYPAGACLVHETCFMQTGPENPDALTASGTGFALAYAVSSPAQPISPAIGMGHQRRLTSDSAGTTIHYPTAGGWRFLFTNNASSLSVGLVFAGDNCS